MRNIKTMNKKFRKYGKEMTTNDRNRYYMEVAMVVESMISREEKEDGDDDDENI